MKNNADDGHIQSMLSYAKMCYSGEGVEINKKEAAAYFKKAADLGESHAMFEYGKMLINGDGIPENKLKGMDYLEKSVEKQDVNVMYLYGQLLRKGEGVPSDKIEGANYLKLSADKGNPKAKFAYGQMLLAGEGIPKNEEEGLRLIEQSTILNPDMMVEYGEMLKNGEIIPVNKKLAAEYFEKAVHLFDPKAMYLLGLMKIAGDGIKMNRNDGMRLLKFAADCKYIDAMRAYAGFLILYQDKEYISEAVNYIKIASEKGDLISFYLYKYVFLHLIYHIKNEEMHFSSKNTEKNISNTIENTKNPIINVNIYDSYIFENNNFAFLQHSTIPQSILNEFLEKLQKSKSFRGIQSNSIHQNDPNSIYTYYFLSSNNFSLVSTILNEIMQKHNIQSMKPNWNVDMFFNEKIIPTDVLNLLLPYLQTLKNIKSVVRNVFDGRQIASYILLHPTMLNVQKYINDSIQDFLLPKGLIFDKIKYPLEKNIIINEELILKNKKDFDLIIEEIQKIGIEPINIERNRLYLYGDYFIRKLFQTFSFICFKTENEKMEALNHINSIVYATKKKVLKYKMNLHYAKIDDSAYPKNVRDNLVHLFESFKGIQDIQEHVLSIENPVVRTYVGFDSLKHLKKAYKKFFHYVDILRFGFLNPNIFLKKKNLIYLYIEKTIDPQIENIISNYFASDVQKNCIEFYGDKFALNLSQILELNFYGFDSEDNLNKAVNLLRNNSIKYFIYHGIRSFINKISDVPEEYLFYDSF